ncbi:MAG TPA: metal-dependent transcriptional regulator [Lachnospiraceae bacterium]|jgi:Mn-dependent DtxR family transcriptional regulator|nr:metal-dependent transcriptional regulator [Lachnospiraceae bacterium]
MDAVQEYSITRSKEDYLRVIFELSKSKESIRSSDVAEKLGITRASVSRMMTELKKSGLIEKEKYGSVVLTERGYKLAAQIKNKHALIKVFLTNVLGVSESIANIDACSMEHAVSHETAEKLNNQLSKLLCFKE